MNTLMQIFIDLMWLFTEGLFYVLIYAPFWFPLVLLFVAISALLQGIIKH